MSESIAPIESNSRNEPLTRKEPRLLDESTKRIVPGLENESTGKIAPVCLNVYHPGFSTLRDWGISFEPAHPQAVQITVLTLNDIWRLPQYQNNFSKTFFVDRLSAYIINGIMMEQLYFTTWLH